MITTVTTSTVTTITSTVTTRGLAGGLALVVVLLFLVLVIQREIVGSTTSGRWRTMMRGLNIGLIPIGLAFSMIAGARLIQVLR
jgi:hypothetical protein